MPNRVQEIQNLPQPQKESEGVLNTTPAKPEEPQGPPTSLMPRPQPAGEQPSSTPTAAAPTQTPPAAGAAPEGGLSTTTESMRRIEQGNSGVYDDQVRQLGGSAPVEMTTPSGGSVSNVTPGRAPGIYSGGTLMQKDPSGKYAPAPGPATPTPAPSGPATSSSLAPSNAEQAGLAKPTVAPLGTNKPRQPGFAGQQGITGVGVNRVAPDGQRPAARVNFLSTEPKNMRTRLFPNVAKPKV